MRLWRFITNPDNAQAATVLFTFVIAVATITYTIATIWYTKISARQFQATQKALQQDRRAVAYLTAKSEGSRWRRKACHGSV